MSFQDVYGVAGVCVYLLQFPEKRVIPPRKKFGFAPEWRRGNLEELPQPE